MAELQQIIPRPGEIQPDKPYKIPDERWREFVEESYGSAELPKMIHFAHDERWDRRFWSIQNAANQVGGISFLFPTHEIKANGRQFGFWSVIGILFVVADLGWFFFRVHW